MKKFFKIFAIAAAALFTVAIVSAFTAFTEPEDPQVAIELAGFESPMYMSLATCDAIYNLLPADMQDAACVAYKDITKKLPNRASMYYAGVKVARHDDTWTFKYEGNTVVVNGTTDDFNAIFTE